MEPPGRWSIAFTKDGTAKIFVPPGRPENLLTRMHAGVSTGKVTFGPTADGFCTGDATYTWKISGRTLVLTGTKDDCHERQILLTAGPWSHT